MPIYQYKCEKCDEEKERLVSFSNADEQQCGCEDDAPLKRLEVVNQLNFALKGNWFSKNQRY